jgi:hypothetical protein
MPGQRHVDLVGPGIVAIDGYIGPPTDVADENRSKIESAKGQSRFVDAPHEPEIVREVSLRNDARNIPPVARRLLPDPLEHKSMLSETSVTK